MNLSDIIRADQNRYTDMTINVQSIYGTVSITDDNNFQDEIFLQGDDASNFISEAWDIYHSCGDVSFGEVYHHLAIAYAENLWN